MIIQHFTLLTGHTVTHRLDLVAPAALAACRGLLPAGGPVPGAAAFRVEIQSPIFTIYRGRDPLVCCGVGRGPEPLWTMLADLQRVAAPPPPAGLWLATVILPRLALCAQSDLGWLGDFERCLAAAITLPL